MKQVLQDMAKGGTLVTEAPAPQVSKEHIVINSRVSLISAGTERMLVGFGKASYLEKARQQPEKVKMVLEKVQTDGLMTTIEAVRSKLGQPLPLGYCNVGVVSEVGSGVEGFKVGDRVVSNGPHADVVKVSKNLCARIPDEVDDEKGYGWPGFSKLNLWKQDKGQNACAKAFLDGLQSGQQAIPAEEIFEVADVTIQVAELLRKQ